MKEKYPNKNILYFDYYKIMVMFSIKMILVSVDHKIRENTAPINKAQELPESVWRITGVYWQKDNILNIHNSFSLSILKFQPVNYTWNWIP